MNIQFEKVIGTIGVAIFVFWAMIPFAEAQVPAGSPYQTQEYSEGDRIPVLIKHLPDWESVRESTTFAHDVTALKAKLGERPVLDQIDLTPGTEAALATYPAGKLLIVEFASPQSSAEADGKITASLADDATTAYRRIGNYNAFVFDAKDAASAAALLDQVKYEKDIQWLGKNPFRITPERAFVLTTSDIFLSTVIVIVMGIGIAILGGLIAGFTYFMFRERRRAGMSAYTDAGGMTRLNLDGFTPDLAPERLLGE
jgi:hypothetical protein